MGVNHQIFDQLDSHVPGRLKPEGRHAMGKAQIVINRFGHVNNVQSPSGQFREF